MSNFKDNFSKQSDVYLKHRPTYPDELFLYLSKLTDDHSLAWDCGTGNGQAAHGLTKYYKKIYATDASQKQIENAIQHGQIKYGVEPADRTTLSDQSVDLITVAIALHWFDHDSFYKEVRRVVKPGGIIAAWTYRLPTVTPEIDAVVQNFHDEVVDEHWQRENRLVSDGYKTIPFPFAELDHPAFIMSKNWSLDDLLGLVRSWSAVQRIINQTGENPVPILENELLEVWGNRETEREMVWKLILKIGRV
ncbi:MAG: class I SAM-dependent methyltransferase [Cyclobacteriaceae bacterium]